MSRAIYLAGLFLLVWFCLIMWMLIIKLIVPLTLPEYGVLGYVAMAVAKAVVVVLMVGLWLYVWKSMSDRYFGWAMKKRGIELN